jgi:hypothetical protein
VSAPDRQAFTAGYDEGRDAAGSPRPGYAEAFGALDGCDLDGLRRTVAHGLAQRGVSFGAQPFVVDPVPRLICAAEWDALADGLAQRARALNRFLLDAYGERRIVRAGVVSAATIEQAEGYEPELVGRMPRGSPAAVIGFDVVRDPAGDFLVLEDNLRTPSGFAYALAARAALRDALPPDSLSRGRSTRSPTSCWTPPCAPRRPQPAATRRSSSSPTAPTTSPTTSTRRPLVGWARRWRRSPISSATATACACASPTRRPGPSTSSTGARTRIASATSTAS